MAEDLIWAMEALDDIDAVVRYVARDSAVHARRVVSEIFGSESSDAADSGTQRSD